MSSQTRFAHLKKTSGISLVNSTALYPSRHQAGDPGLPLLVVDNPLARAVISLQGAQILAFKPTDRAEMLWVSPKARLESGQPIRGGIPLCLPWFGPGPDGKSMHGFARTHEWSLSETRTMPDGSTYLALELRVDGSESELWPHAFTFRLEALVGTELKLGLTVENRSPQVAPLAFAFHTYFAVANVADIRVGGLEDLTFIDKIEHSARKTQHGEVRIDAVTDRVYLDVPVAQTLRTATGDIQIESDTKCAIVWNAWTNDKTIADLGEGHHVGYVCVERGDVADQAIALKPGQKYRRWMILANQ